MRLLGLFLALGMSGCIMLTANVGVPSPPIAWRLVEDDLEQGRVLVLEPDARPWRVEVRLSRERATAGEIVEAEVWLPEAEGRHRIEASPNRPDVSILGPREFEVDGQERVRIRFTCASVGRGGILVVVKE